MPKTNKQLHLWILGKLRRQRRREQEQRGQIIQEGHKNLAWVELRVLLVADGYCRVDNAAVSPPHHKTRSMPFPWYDKGRNAAERRERVEHKAYPGGFNGGWVFHQRSRSRVMLWDQVRQFLQSQKPCRCREGLNLSDLGVAASAVATGIFAGKRAEFRNRAATAPEMEKGMVNTDLRGNRSKGQRGIGGLRSMTRTSNSNPKPKIVQDIWQF